MAGIHNVQLWSYALNGDTIEISAPTYNFTTMSILAQGGSVYITTNGIANGIPSSTITILDGQSITIDAAQGNTIEYVSITADSVANIIAR